LFFNEHVRAADAKEAGVKNPTEETCCHPDALSESFPRKAVNHNINPHFCARCRTDFFERPVLPHKCGVPPGPGTPHLCGSEEFCLATFCAAPVLLSLAFQLEQNAHSYRGPTLGFALIRRLHKREDLQRFL
jgi:hypothetical protein